MKYIALIFILALGLLNLIAIANLFIRGIGVICRLGKPAEDGKMTGKEWVNLFIRTLILLFAVNFILSVILGIVQVVITLF